MKGLSFIGDALGTEHFIVIFNNLLFSKRRNNQRRVLCEPIAAFGKEKVLLAAT